MTELVELRMAVTGLSCSGCVSALTKTALAIPGVCDCDVELCPQGASQVTVRHVASTGESSVVAQLAAAGYDIALSVSP